MKQIPLVIVHGGCRDGFGSAWVAHKKFLAAEFHYATHAASPQEYKLPPNIDGREVYMIDFAYPLEQTKELLRRAAKVIILDHHRTAFDNLSVLDNPDFHFDMKKCGTHMAWDYFFPDQRAPWLVPYIEAHDIWTWDQPHAAEVLLALETYPRDFATWYELAQRDVSEFIADGTALLRFQKQQLARLKDSVRMVEFEGRTIPFVNANIFVSELGNLLALDHPFAVVWSFDGKQYQYSMRSAHGIDVQAIALKYGGGGHAAAAGFRTTERLF